MVPRRSEEFFQAIRKNDEEKVRAMLEKDPSLIFVKLVGGEGTCFAAALDGYTKVLATLLDFGAPFHVRDKNGALPIHALVAFCDDVHLLERMLEICPGMLTATTDHGETLLHYAAMNFHTEVYLQHLLEKRAFDVNRRDNWGRTALHYATSNEKSLRLLLAAGADVDVVDKKGISALHLAAMKGVYQACTVLLLEAGASVDPRDEKGETPLHYAAYYRSPSSVKALLERGAYVGAKDCHGNTPSQKTRSRKIILLLTGAKSN